jgi:hypothetical protein
MGGTRAGIGGCNPTNHGGATRFQTRQTRRKYYDVTITHRGWDCKVTCRLAWLGGRMWGSSSYLGWHVTLETSLTAFPTAVIFDRQNIIQAYRLYAGASSLPQAAPNGSSGPRSSPQLGLSSSTCCGHDYIFRSALCDSPSLNTIISFSPSIHRIPSTPSTCPRNRQAPPTS